MKLQKQNYFFISKWLVYWLTILGFYLLVLSQNGVTYKSSCGVIITYYYIASLLGIYFFSKDYSFKKLIPLTGLIILGTLVGVGLGEVLKPLSSIQLKSLYEYHFYYPMLEIPSSLSKLSEVLFQQVMIYLLVNYLFDYYQSIKKAVYVFAIVFVILHIPLFFIFSYIALFFIIPSVLAGSIFSFIILRYKKGYLLSYLIHLVFYLGMAIFMRISGFSVYDFVQ